MAQQLAGPWSQPLNLTAAVDATAATVAAHAAAAILMAWAH